MLPPVANIFSKVTPDEGDVVTIDNKEYYIPGGTLIGYSAMNMHRNNRTVYGEDCGTFRPERWLIDTNDVDAKDHLTRMTKTNDLIFGYGRWDSRVGLKSVMKQPAAFNAPMIAATGVGVERERLVRSQTQSVSRGGRPDSRSDKEGQVLNMHQR